MKAELNHFDRVLRIQLEICLDSEDLAEVFEQKMLQISTKKKNQNLHADIIFLGNQTRPSYS